MQTKYYQIPFADYDNERTPVPEHTQDHGRVSYPEGYSNNYEQDQKENPFALALERKKLNQLLYDTTHNLKQWQHFGLHEYCMDTVYNKGWRCLFDDKTINTGPRAYVSTVDQNENIPCRNGVVQKGWQLADMPQLDLDGYAKVGHKHSTSDITSGILPVNRGGSGVNSFPARRLLISGSSTTAPLTTLSAGYAGQVLRSGVSGALPFWDEYKGAPLLYQRNGSVTGTAPVTLNLHEDHTGYWIERAAKTTVKFNPAGLTRPQSNWITFEVAFKLNEIIENALNWSDKIIWQDGEKPDVHHPGLYFFGFRSLNNYQEWHGSLLGYWPLGYVPIPPEPPRETKIYNITYNMHNLNLYDYVGRPTGNKDIIINVYPNVIIGSGSTGQPALVTGVFPGECTLTLNIQNGAYISGAGGRGGVGLGYSGDTTGQLGGRAMLIQTGLTINNRGVIQSGGKGGDGGAGGYTSINVGGPSWLARPPLTSSARGGAGGGGAGWNPGIGGGSNIPPAYPQLNWKYDRPGGNGEVGTLTTGGAGGLGEIRTQSYETHDGGWTPPREVTAVGQTGEQGGAPGSVAAIEGKTYISWAYQGRIIGGIV